MKPKNILVFGATGQIGRNLIRKLTKENYKVTAVTRNLHRKGYILKTQGNPGYIDIVETNVFDIDKLRALISNCDICINLIGILYEKRNHTFENIHKNFPSILSNLCKEKGIEQFIHISALGIDEATESKYAKSKLEGEINIKKNFPESIILRPSICYSVDDKFTNQLMTLLSLLPIFPLYYKGETKFMPIHCSDLTEIIFQIILKKIQSETIECIGPEKISFKEIIQYLLNSINKKRILVPIPLFFANLSANFFELLPKPLLTKDQLKLLKYDNIPSGKYKTNFDFNIKSKLIFKEEIDKYSYMWKEGGYYSKSN
tara:strand:+ start:13 stop:960 length:948 start_codon:yes stop_codon:yes gene_type:complete